MFHTFRGHAVKVGVRLNATKPPAVYAALCMY